MSSEGPLFVTPTSCDCAFRSTHRLPCRHMFARRQKEGLPSYDVTIVDKRWTASYCGIIPDVPTSSSLSLRRSQTPPPTPAALTSHQKYRQVMAIASDLAGMASEVGHVEFLEHVDVSKQLRTEWANAVVPVAPPPCRPGHRRSSSCNTLDHETYVSCSGGENNTVRQLIQVFSRTNAHVFLTAAESVSLARPASTVVASQLSLGQLKLPPVVAKRGRPKGNELTAIGLPKRPKRDGPQKFRMRLPRERERGK